MPIIRIAEAVRRFVPGAVLPSDEAACLAPALGALLGKRAARTLLESVGAAGIARMTAAELAAAAGISPALAKRVVTARDLGDALARQGGGLAQRSSDVLRHLPLGLERFEVEVLLALVLSGVFDVQALLLLSVGGSAGASLRMRDVLAPLVRLRAHGFVLAHNHPSGSYEPSSEDVDLTNRIARAARLVDLELIDHLIVSAGGTFSFRDHDLLLTPHELGA